MFAQKRRWLISPIAADPDSDYVPFVRPSQQLLLLLFLL